MGPVQSTFIMRRCIDRLVGVSLAVLVAFAGSDAVADPPAGDTSWQVPQTPKQLAMRAWLDTQTALWASSSDLRVRLIYSTGTTTMREGTTVYGKDFFSTTDLIALARGSTDPVLLDLLLQRCSRIARGATSEPCDRASLARRWVDADTQNQVAWLALAGILDIQGDATGAVEAVRRAGQASQWHEHAQDIAELIARSAPRTATIQQRNAVLREALSRAASGTSVVEILTLSRYCWTGTMQDPCRRIADAMARDSSTTLGLAFAGHVAESAGAPDWIIDTFMRKHDAVEWELHLVSIEEPPSFADLDDASAAIVNTALQERIARGERGYAEHRLQIRRVSEEDAASRYVATLTPESQRFRAESRLFARHLADQRVLNADSTRSTAASP